MFVLLNQDNLLLGFKCQINFRFIKNMEKNGKINRINQTGQTEICPYRMCLWAELVLKMWWSDSYIHGIDLFKLTDWHKHLRNLGKKLMPCFKLFSANF